MAVVLGECFAASRCHLDKCAGSVLGKGLFQILNRLYLAKVLLLQDRHVTKS